MALANGSEIESLSVPADGTSAANEGRGLRYVADLWTARGKLGLPVVVNWYCHTSSTIGGSKNKRQSHCLICFCT
jgi:hypothetical protein